MPNFMMLTDSLTKTITYEKHLSLLINLLLFFIMTFSETASLFQCARGNLENSAYDITVSTGSGNYSTQFKFLKFHHYTEDYSFSTQAVVNYRLEYCYRIFFVRPLNVRQFSITNGYNFSPIYSFPKNTSNSDYKFIYVGKKKENEIHFFRIKQVYSNGYARFSETKSIELENTDELKINIYSNPSNGVVGIKFVNIFSGKFLIQISQYTSSDSFQQRIRCLR
jgi:hypothetical protein